MGFLLVISVILALAMALGLFVVLPTAISGFLAEGMKVLPVAVLEFLAERGVVFESGFLGKGIEELWCYYCCSQGNRNLANRFMAMPSARNRIIGLEMYIEGIRGFLQWGYNFYYSRLSKRAIDPYLITDADRGFPAGDAYSVYPTENGASPSLRLKVFKSGIADMCAAKLLESMIGKEAVREIVLSRGKIAFTGAPHTADDLLFIREKINEKIKETIQNDASKN